MPWSQSDIFIGCYLRKEARGGKTLDTHTHSNFRKAIVNLATYLYISAQKLHVLAATPKTVMIAIHISAISTRVK